MKRYTKEQLKDIMINYYNNVGFPTQRAFRVSNGLPSYGTYVNAFGSFKKAIDYCGIEVPKKRQWLYEREEYTREEVLESFRNAVDSEIVTSGRLLTDNDIDSNKSMVSSNVLYKHFGSLDKAYKLIGIDRIKYNTKLKEKDMKDKYIEIRNILGRTPHSRDFDRFSSKDDRYYACKTYLAHFGTIQKLQKLMGDEPYILGHGMSKEELLNRLKRLADSLDLVPTQQDLTLCPYTPSSATYAKHFGSYSNALKEIGLVARGLNQKFITPSGNLALSGYEYQFMLVLEKYDIKYTKEELYSSYIKNFNKRYRFDFTLDINDRKYFIEIFGITGNKKYDDKIEEKIEVCKSNNLNLIDLYGDDIGGKSFEDIYKLLNKRIDKI